MRPATALELAEAALAEPMYDKDDRVVTCRKCGFSWLKPCDKEPSAFCDGCVWVVLDILAQAVVDQSRRP